MLAFLTSLLLVGIGELGDKTQLLTFNFALKYPRRTVFTAVVIATLFLQLVAVLLGNLLGNTFDPLYLRIIAGVLFVSFGIWELIPEAQESPRKEILQLSPFFVVFVSFLLAEMGDKTQLAAAALAMQYKNWVGVWAGASLGMITADLLAIWVAGFFRTELAKTILKYMAAVIFIVYGASILIAVFIVHPTVITVPR